MELEHYHEHNARVPFLQQSVKCMQLAHHASTSKASTQRRIGVDAFAQGVSKHALDRLSSKYALARQSEEHLLQQLLNHVLYGDDPQRLCRRLLPIHVPRPHGILQSATGRNPFSLSKSKAGHHKTFGV